METALHIATRKTLTAAERKAADDKAEREFDLTFLARMKKRKQPKAADYAKMTTHEQLKKELGL